MIARVGKFVFCGALVWETVVFPIITGIVYLGPVINPSIKKPLLTVFKRQHELLKVLSY